MLTIRNASVFCRDGAFHPGNISIRNGVFTEEPLAPSASQSRAAGSEDPRGTSTPADFDLTELDASGCYAIPGLVDLHFHGALGADICDGSRAAFEKIASYEASCGITAICPATLTLPVSHLEQVLATGAALSRDQEAAFRQVWGSDRSQDTDRLCAAKQLRRTADLVGFNMEGPFISWKKRGAQNPDYLLPCSLEITDRFLAASGGLLKIIGLAPEANPDFENYIRSVREKVIVSLAHTDADYDTARRALSAGASHLVHLYDAMRDLTHRDPGPVGAAMDEIRSRSKSNGSDPEGFSRHPNQPDSLDGKNNITCEIICDGIHVHPSAVRAAFAMMGREHMILISDSLRSTGMPDGEYDLGGQAVVKKGKYCRLREEGNIAGSVSNLMDCLRTAVTEMEIPLEDAIASASLIPARKIGVDSLYGSIEVGKRGNVVLLDPKDLHVCAVVKDGEVIKC